MVEVKKEELLKSESPKKNDGIFKTSRRKSNSKCNNSSKINREVKVKLELSQQINIKLEPEEDLNIIKQESDDERPNIKSEYLIKEDSDSIFNLVPQALSPDRSESI